MSKYVRELTWQEARDVAIALRHAILALHGIPCPDCVPPRADFPTRWPSATVPA